MLFKRLLIRSTLAFILVANSPLVSANVIVLNNTLISDFFDGISIEIDKPIVISKRAQLFRITGEVNITDPYQAIENVSNKTGLIWYDNGTAIYVYSADELKTEFIPVYTRDDFEEIKNYLNLAKLYDNRYPMRYTKGAAFVGGTPLYVQTVRDAVTAFYNGKAKEEAVKAEKAAAQAKATSQTHYYNDSENQTQSVPNLNLPGQSSTTYARELVNPADKEVIKIFHLKHRFVEDMNYKIRGQQQNSEGALSVLSKLLGGEASKMTIVADPLNNSIYVRGKVKDVDNVASLIEEIDVVRSQIQLSLWIIDVDMTEINEIGNNVKGIFKNDLLNLSVNGGASIILDPTQTLSFVSEINFLEEEKKAKVLSRPILITQNNTPAVIDTNETIYVRLLGDREVALQEITYGTILSVTPRVVSQSDPEGSEIEMMVEIEDGNQTSDLIDGIPNVRRSVVSTMGRIKNTQSLLLGGFVRKETVEQNLGIPILKNIPIVKHLFSMDMRKTSSVMRLFMIEPKIIVDPAMEFDRRRLINLQSEAFLKNTKISPTPQPGLDPNQAQDNASELQTPHQVDLMSAPPQMMTNDQFPGGRPVPAPGLPEPAKPLRYPGNGEIPIDKEKLKKKAVVEDVRFQEIREKYIRQRRGL